MRRTLWLAVAVSIVAVAATAAAATSFAGGGGGVANFTPSTNKILYSGWATPANGGLSHYTDIGRLAVPVGSYTLTAHTVVELASTAPSGTDVECYLTAPNVNPQYTAGSVGPAKGSNIRALDVQSITNAPNGGNADVYCRVNTKADSKLVKARATSIIATPVPGASWTSNAAPAFGTY